jgi:hypothetical protein
MPVKHQLMVWLQFVGQEGNTNLNHRVIFKIGRGMCELARNRVVKALNNVRAEFITWPDTEELKEIGERIEKKYHVPNFPIMMDGTLLRLAITPEYENSADYHGRKFTYSLTVNILNDDRRQIRAYLAGFPGSTHDNRDLKNMKQYQTPEELFSLLEYVMCDTAYKPTDFCVPAYKCVSVDVLLLHPDKTLFNTVSLNPPIPLNALN